MARGLFSRKSEQSEGSGHSVGGAAADGSTGGMQAGAMVSPELQSALTKIMERTAKLEAISLSELNPTDLQQVNSQVETLKRDLQNKEAEIAQLKAGGEAKPSAEAGDLSARIKELEAKLAEYEILEDDIADLSLYKEENSRLRLEVEKFKGGSVAPVASTPASVAIAPPVPDIPAPIEVDQGAQAASAVALASDEIVAEFAQAVGQESLPTADPTLTDMQIPDTGNPMADFENTVKLEKQIKPQAPPAPPSSTPPEEKDDLFAEFAQSKPQEDEEEFGANLDTDKMMAEMAALVGTEPGGSALEEDVDTDKMVLEMSGLNSKA